jgi:hypothetical protein
MCVWHHGSVARNARSAESGSEMKRLLVALLFACSCADAEITQVDQQDIAGVIGKLFVALQHGDDDAVFALQTEDTRKMFKTPGQFAAELKKCCTALHETVNQAVISTVESETGVVAFVLLIDTDDDYWSAQFIMEKHAVWQIDQIHIKLIDEAGTEKMRL